MLVGNRSVSGFFGALIGRICQNSYMNEQRTCLKSLIDIILVALVGALPEYLRQPQGMCSQGHSCTLGASDQKPLSRGLSLASMKDVPNNIARIRQSYTSKSLHPRPHHERHLRFTQQWSERSRHMRSSCRRVRSGAECRQESHCSAVGIS